MKLSLLSFVRLVLLLSFGNLSDLPFLASTLLFVLQVYLIELIGESPYLLLLLLLLLILEIDLLDETIILVYECFPLLLLFPKLPLVLLNCFGCSVVKFDFLRHF